MPRSGPPHPRDKHTGRAMPKGDRRARAVVPFISDHAWLVGDCSRYPRATRGCARAVMVAVAVNADRRRMTLGITVIPSKTATFRADVLWSFTHRGDARDVLKAVVRRVPGAAATLEVLSGARVFWRPGPRHQPRLLQAGTDHRSRSADRTPDPDQPCVDRHAASDANSEAAWQDSYPNPFCGRPQATMLSSAASESAMRDSSSRSVSGTSRGAETRGSGISAMVPRPPCSALSKALRSV